MSDDGNEHLNGVPWWEAPPPPRLHRHWAQTTGMISDFERVERCACGVIRSNISTRWCLLDPPRVAPGVLRRLSTRRPARPLVL